MRPEQPTFWLLNGATGWRTGDTQAVAVGEDAGIRLAANVSGPLALDSVDGSLGGLVLPIGMAFDAEQRLYLLDLDEAVIKRFDAELQGFDVLSTVGGEGDDARNFHLPTNIAIAADDLYVTDRGNARVQVFALSTLALRHVWGPWGIQLCCPAAEDESNWDPVDVAVIGDEAYILDRHYGRVLLHRSGEDSLQTVIAANESRQMRWSRVMVDAQHRIYLLDDTGSIPTLDVFDVNGVQVDEVFDSGELLDYFPSPAVRLDHRQRFCLPQNLLQACAQSDPSVAPFPNVPLWNCRNGKAGLLFDRKGNVLDPVTDPEPAGPFLYQRKGVWTSEPLDSQIYACQWHQIDIDLADLPVGTQLLVSTYTDNESRPIDDINALPGHLWETQFQIIGQMQPTASAELPVPHQTDTLILSHEGQFLWLRLELFGDGFVTPVVKALRSHYPRDSYIKHLPAVYSSDDESRRFLERFLSLFQAEWDAMEAVNDDIAMYFDPDAVPEGAFLKYLAEWLALPLEGAWTEEQKRRLLSAAPEIYPERGTAKGLRRYLQVYLSNLTGLEQEELREFPVLVEGFRQRDYLTLAVKDHATLGGQHALWSASVVARLQLDVFAREGDVRLVSTGDPDRDVFHVHAHRFQVLLPSAWIKTSADEVMLRRALDAEKPAHTQYDLCLIEPRFRVGIQSTLGIDSIIGEYPVAVLSCAEEKEVSINRPPRNRLGYDTVLAGGPGLNGGMPLNPDTRIGVNTQLS
jgi:phage tail-like protein